jgi:dTDP-4-amino-4,6-dideoxygalactose transaminase
MLTYQALGAGPGRRVLLPSFTFAASAHAVVWAGAEVDFCEVSRERCSLDVDDATKHLEPGPPVAAVSATHVYGHPAEVEALEDLATAHAVPVVYDAAHALGSTRGGQPVGGFGTAEVFSLSPTKVVVAGEGGLVTTNDRALAEDLRLGRDYGNPGDYDCRFPGLNARMSELHAAVAIASLADLDAHLEHRYELVRQFEESVGDIPGLRVIRPAEGDRSTYKDLTIVLDVGDFGMDGARLQSALAAEGVDTRRYYAPPSHRQTAYSGRWASARPLPVTDDLATTVLSLPLWSHMPSPTIHAISDAIRQIQAHASAIRPPGAGTR